MTTARMAGDNLLGMDRERLKALMGELDEKPFHAVQLMRWIHRRRVLNLSAMTNLSKRLRAHLGAHASLTLPEINSCHTSVDGTIKWSLRVDEANCVEMVFIPEDGRGTLCISSQAGCPLRCSFCATSTPTASMATSGSGSDSISMIRGIISGTRRSLRARRTYKRSSLLWLLSNSVSRSAGR